jgi:hypothetical protein
MLLTSQRVKSPDGQEGINAFCYLHGPYDWAGEPPLGIPDANVGQRVNEQVNLRPGGNKVRSYLDIIAPDETPTSEILASVRPFLGRMRGRALPWVGTVGRTTFRFGLELGLGEKWGAEFGALLDAALQVRVPP